MCENSGCIDPANQQYKGLGRVMRTMRNCSNDCKIYGGHDFYAPVPKCVPPSRKKKTSKVNTLGAPVGMIQSSYTMSTLEMDLSVLQPQRFATILKTLAKVYMKPEVTWTTDTVDDIMQEGQALFLASQEEPNNEPTSPTIYNDFEKRIQREFKYDTVLFRIELNEKYSLEPKSLDFDDGSDSSATGIEYLPKSLKMFFESSAVKYALLMIDDWYLMIWHTQGVYFVADFYGRNKRSFMSDRENGIAMVISLREIGNVIHLIMELSNLQPESTFNLREMRVVKLTTPDGRTQTRDYLKRKNEWVVVSSNYAYLRATLHLSLNPLDPVRNRSALTTAVGALLASKIDHPATWTAKQLDQLMCFGVTFCRCCWVPCLDTSDPLQIENFPRFLKLGQFYISFDITPRMVRGTWARIVNYKHTALTIAIQELFESGYDKLILQIDHQNYAIFQKAGYIYIMDSFRHRVKCKKQDETLDDKFATLRMFRQPNVFFNVLNQLLCANTATSTFYIHVLRVKRIATSEGEANKPFKENEDDDVISLNEFICYEEDEVRCYDLADISDFGDDDTSIPSELPIPPSCSTIGEEMEEEGEGGFGEMDGVETASTDDD